MQQHQISNIGPTSIFAVDGFGDEVEIKPGQVYIGVIQRVRLPERGCAEFSIEPFEPPTR